MGFKVVAVGRVYSSEFSGVRLVTDGLEGGGPADLTYALYTATAFLGKLKGMGFKLAYRCGMTAQMLGQALNRDAIETTPLIRIISPSRKGFGPGDYTFHVVTGVVLMSGVASIDVTVSENISDTSVDIEVVFAPDIEALKSQLKTLFLAKRVIVDAEHQG